MDEFIELYHSIKKIEARRNLTQLALISHAFGGSKKENKGFIKSLSAWLPKWEKQNGGTRDDFVSAFTKGRKK